MKFHLIFVTFVAFCKVEAFSKGSKDDAIQKAFVNISETLAQQNHLISVVVDGEPAEKKESVLLATMAGIPHVVKSFGSETKKLELNSSAIVLLDSVASLETFNNRTILPPTFLMMQHLFIYCRDGTFEKVKMMKTFILRKSILQYEYFVIEEEKSIRLLTFVWFTRKRCNEAKLVEVNKFDKSLGRWKHGNFEIDKFSNLNGCLLNFILYEQMPEFKAIKIGHKNKAITKCIGYACAIVKDFSSALNYKYTMYHTNREVINHMILFTSSLNFKSKLDPRNEFVFTRPIYYVEQFITVPPGEEFNGYEKLILPFDEPTWMWISITFASAFATILALRFTRTDFVNFVVGKRIASPALNVIRAFFGVSQVMCPGRNFARYLLMMFILFSLVIRTAYQGVMFKFLHKEMRKPTATTIDEMIDQNFTFYMQGNFTKVFPELDFTKRANIIDNYTWPEFRTAYKRIYTPRSKIATMYSLNRTDPPKLLKQRFMLEPKGFLFIPHHFLLDTFDRKLLQDNEADLINYNTRNWTEKSNPKNFEVYKEPFAVLTLGELEAGFVVCVVPLVLSILVFGIEWMVTLKYLIVFLSIFKTYFDLKDLEQAHHSKLMKIKVAAWQIVVQKRMKDFKS